MTQIIKIKRSTTTAAPSSLAAGELAYSEDSRKLFIGRPNDGVVIDIAGELYTDMLDHAAGTLTASSAIVVDANSKIDQFLTGNISITGSTDTIATGSGNLTIAPTGNLVITHGGTIDFSSQANEISIPDNQAAAVNFTEAANSYLKFVTTNGSETVIVGQDTTFANDVSLISDAAVLSFGTDSDVSLTHVPDTALLINGSNGFQFRDSTLFINSSADGQLDIDADIELEITAPIVDINASTEVNISNALVVGGTGDFAGQVEVSGGLSLTGTGEELRFYEESNYVGFRAPALAGDQIWVLPESDGTSGQFLKTNGSGDLSFDTIPTSLSVIARSGPVDIGILNSSFTVVGRSANVSIGVS